MNYTVFKIFFAFLIATTIYHEFVAANIKKRLIMKGLVGAGLLFKAIKVSCESIPLLECGCLYSTDTCLLIPNSGMVFV